MSYSFYAEDSDIGLAAFRHANHFLKSGVKWWTMHPNDEVVQSGKAYALANLGREYLVYSSTGDNFTLELPKGKYAYGWFDPAEGTLHKEISIEHSDADMTFQKPNANDWVLHIKLEDDSTIQVELPPVQQSAN
jgi:hypothetical protein